MENQVFLIRKFLLERFFDRNNDRLEPEEVTRVRVHFEEWTATRGFRNYIRGSQTPQIKTMAAATLEYCLLLSKVGFGTKRLPRRDVAEFIGVGHSTLANNSENRVPSVTGYNDRVIAIPDPPNNFAEVLTVADQAAVGELEEARTEKETKADLKWLNGFNDKSHMYYVYALFRDDLAEPPQNPDRILNALFYIGKGRGGRVHSYKSAAAEDSPRHAVVRYIKDLFAQNRVTMQLFGRQDCLRARPSTWKHWLSSM